MPNTNERDALIAALNDDTAAAHIYPSTLKTFQRGEHGGECWSIKVGNEDEESVGVFTIEQVFNALAATAPNAGAPLADEKRSLMLRFTRVEDGLPELCDYSSSYGGQWSSKWCVVLIDGGSAVKTIRFTESESVKEALSRGERPLSPWRTHGGSYVVAWAYCDDIQNAVAAPAQQAGATASSAPAELPWHLPVSVWTESERAALKAAQQAGAPLPLASSEAVNVNGEPETALSLLADLIDIYDDAESAAPEDRCYVQSAWPDILDLARKFLATPPQATLPASEPSDDEKRKLIGGFFAEAWAVDAALNLLHDYHRLATRAQPQADAAEPQPRLKVRLTCFPESNGKTNWTALLVREEAWDGLIGNCGGISLACGELWNRVAYEAEQARFLIGQRDTEPFILDYGDDIKTPEEWKGETDQAKRAAQAPGARGEQA